jgi:Domain of unknown function (DUF4276)
MVEEIRIYIEGDTKRKGKNSKISLGQGFNSFFKELDEKAKEKKVKFRLIMCGSTAETFKDFLLGVKSHQNSFVAFLIDADNEVGDNETPKSFLQKQEKSRNWNFENVKDEQCHLMVQIMESWFLADVETLKSFYGQNFKHNAIPKQPNIEKIAKPDVEKSLDKAASETNKGKYHKIRHGAELLSKIETGKVRAKAAHCNRLFETINKNLS